MLCTVDTHPLRSSIFRALIPLALLASVFPSPVSSQENVNATASCSDLYKYTRSSELGRNIQTVLQTLLQDAPDTGYKSTSQGSITGGDVAYGLLQCRGDITTNECKSCAAAAVQVVNNTCVRNSTKGGRVFQETCFLRYEDHFFASLLDTISNQVTCSGKNRSAAYSSNLNLALEFIKDRVPQSERKFTATVAGLGSPDPVYALGQCIRDLSSEDCLSCLRSSQDVVTQTCPNAPGGDCYFPTCSLLYSGSKFFQGTPENATLGSKGKSSDSSKGVVIGLPVAGTVVVVLILLALGWFLYRKRKSEKHAPVGELDELQLTLNRGPVTFSYELLRYATNDFSELYKLGEGGFGAVYKGVFRDGTELAIKKLSVASKQGEQQFLNEVRVISSVQHRNLVKLLGCCVQGTERLLVYEFLINNSLERALFGGGGGEKPELSWQMRYNILIGTARGLTYLHEDSQIRIVHRDIKLSNILLDEKFEAKIADFGLARLYGEDETSEIITTKVAGTYGYMAPEYAFHGQLSEKADVFSFGIVVLETISGRKNRDVTLPGEEQYLLEWAWQLYSDGRLGSLLDPELVREDDNEVSRKLLSAVEIALLCTQASPQARPTMSHVVAMLSGHSNVQVPLGSSFDASMKPLALFSQATSSSAASNDSKQRQRHQNLSKTFTEPLPR